MIAQFAPSRLGKHPRSALTLLLLGIAALAPAWAADTGKDCAPVGSLPGYPATGAPDHYAYKLSTFNEKNGDDTKIVDVAGLYCQQSYEFDGKGDPDSELESQSNFRDQFNQLGAKIVFTNDSETDATFTKDGKPVWAQVSNSNEHHITVTVVEQRPFVATLTKPDANDYKLIGHMPNFAADGKPTTRRFDENTFTVQDGSDTKQVKAQGALFEQSYSLKKDAPPSSRLEAQLNYRAALKAVGAQIVFTNDHETVARFDNHGQTVWIDVTSTNEHSISVSVIEEKPFKASIKPADASAMKAALDKDGHIALYINFDFDKATLRPDAAPIVAQVVTLLKDNADLKLSVDGNTDNVGDHDYNVKLSKDRAATVVAELVKAGIAADRLKAVGDGPDKPIADNDSSEGRAKNRRVELVKV